MQVSSGVRRRILISAYACDPTQGSEPGMGGNWVIRLARYHDLCVLTHVIDDNPAPLQDYLDCHPELQEHIRVVGVRRIRYGEGLWSHLYYWTYMLWQREAYRSAQHLHEAMPFDLVHQLNMIGFREPGFLWKLGIPFIWGPIGGHAQMPWRFLPSLGMRGGVHYGVRNILNWVQMRSSSRVKKAMRRANVLMAATHEDEAAIREIHRRPSVLMNEQGAQISNSQARTRSWDGRRPLRLVWCGQFLARKGLHLGLSAIARVKAAMPLELTVIGWGPLEAAWRAQAAKLEIDSICHWKGRLSHSDVLEEIGASDALLFTSLQEGTPATVLEAIQAGVPVFCHDACGFGTAIDDSCGFKIPMVSPSQSIEGFASALRALHAQPERLLHLSEGALKRAQELSWERKVDEVLVLYQRALETRDAPVEMQ